MAKYFHFQGHQPSMAEFFHGIFIGNACHGKSIASPWQIYAISINKITHFFK
jgi:hypothetical protein